MSQPTSPSRNQNSPDNSNLDCQETIIKIELARRINLLEPIIVSSDDEDVGVVSAATAVVEPEIKLEPWPETSRIVRMLTPMEVVNLPSSSSLVAQPTQDPVIELPDDEDILEIMTQYSLLGPEVVISSDDEDVIAPIQPPSRIIRSRAKRVSKPYFELSSTPMSAFKRQQLRKRPKSMSALISSIPQPTGTTSSRATEESMEETMEIKISANNETSSPPPSSPPPPPHITTEAAATATLSNTDESNNQQQNRNQTRRCINQFKRDLKMDVVDNGNYRCKIEHVNRTVLVNAIADRMLAQMNSNQFIVPRFIASFWKMGKLCFICADMTTRQFLIDTVASLPELWPDCSLAVVQFDGPRNPKRVRLILSEQVLESCTNFMEALARQNPDLNVYQWEVVNRGFRRYNGDILFDFNIDLDSYKELRRNRGYVYFGFGRLLFNLNANRKLSKLNPFMRRMMYCNLNNQYNVQS